MTWTATGNDVPEFSGTILQPFPKQPAYWQVQGACSGKKCGLKPYALRVADAETAAEIETQAAAREAREAAHEATLVVGAKVTLAPNFARSSSMPEGTVGEIALIMEGGRRGVVFPGRKVSLLAENLVLA